MDKPTKPTNLMPRSFGGVKNNWSASMQTNGYEDGIPAIYGGDNLNYQLDATGKELDYCEKIVDFINDIPIGKTITVDENNKLVYDNLIHETPIATTETAGIVKPDGVTLDIDVDGTLSVVDAGFANTSLNNLDNEGHAKLQYAPFAINSGVVSDGLNNTLQSGNFVKKYSTPDTYTIEIPQTGNYEIALVGAGGGAVAVQVQGTSYVDRSGGGSGAAFAGTITLSAGTYTVIVGSHGKRKTSTSGSATGTTGTATIIKDSSNNIIISAGGGAGGYGSITGSGGHGGAGGTINTSGATIVSTTLSSNGNSGKHQVQSAGSVAGGASVYEGYGYGGSSSSSSGGNGYFSIKNVGGSASTLSSEECIITTTDGRTNVNSPSTTLDISSYANGSYKVFKDFETGDISLVSSLTIAKVAPATPSNNDYWVDISTIPANLKIYDSTNTEWVIDNDLVCIGDCTIESGVITTLTNREFNDSGYLIDRFVTSACMPDYTAGVDVSAYNSSSNLYTAPCDGYFIGAIVGATSNTSRLIIRVYSPDEDELFFVGNSDLTPGSGNHGQSSLTIPIPKGYKFYTDSLGSFSVTKTFYPLKGVSNA